MANEITIGKHKVNTWLIVAGGAGLVLVLYLYRRSSSASSSSTDPSAVDPTTGLPYSQDNQVDPLTGLTYLQEAQQYGSVAAAESAVSSGSAYADNAGYAGGGAVGTAGFPTSNVSGNDVAVASYATNAQWAQAVTAGLVALGYSSTDVSAALGLFFAQHPLTATQASIVQAAEAEYGPPPQGTYQIIQSGNGTTTPPPSGGGGGGSTAPKSAGAISNLQAYGVKRTSFQVRWNPAARATGYSYVLSQLNGVKVHSGSTHGTSVSFTGLHPGFTYNFAVQGLPGGPGDNIHVALPH